MKCEYCGMDVKLCWKCGREFKDEYDVFHYIYKNGENESVYHVCTKCFDDIISHNFK